MHIVVGAAPLIAVVALPVPPFDDAMPAVVTAVLPGIAHFLVAPDPMSIKAS